MTTLHAERYIFIVLLLVFALVVVLLARKKV
jgi:hypothetical protein